MKKPHDSDIFGTKQLGYAPRIVNNQKIDPNTAFQEKMEKQFQSYTKKIGSTHKINSNQRQLKTKVNEQVKFDENYHHDRKQADLQSSIFYQPRSVPSSRNGERAKITQRIVPKHAYNMKDIEQNYGKKQTLNRQVKQLPQNKTNFKGNSSNIFGYDELADRNQIKEKVGKLISHKLQWTEHDSIRYQDYGELCGKEPQQNQLKYNQVLPKVQVENKRQVTKKITQMQQNDNISKQNDIQVGNQMKTKQEKIKNSQLKQKQKKESKKQNKKQPKQSQQLANVQIEILKGWNSNIMELLSKCCKVNSIKMLSVNFQQGGKGQLVLNRGKRWETVVDWLRKDAKLKIKVIN